MWAKIKAFFAGSETIFWARLQTILGAAAIAITYVEPTVRAPIIPSEWFPLFLFANGVATEFLRRRRADDLTPFFGRSGG